MKRTILLGVTKDNELAFGEFETREWANKPNEFSARFNTVRPFNTEHIDIYELTKDYLDCLPPDELWELCCAFDCIPSKLFENYAGEHEICDFIDCSIYPETITINNEDWMFESSCGGQHNLKGQMKYFVNEDLFYFLIDCWNNYHLKEIPTDVYQKLVNQVEKEYNNFDEEEWIRKYIKEHIEEF